MVYKWLKPIEDLVVPYSIFWIAAGALIIKDNKILLVEEKSVYLSILRESERVSMDYQEDEQIAESSSHSAQNDSFTSKPE